MLIQPNTWYTDTQHRTWLIKAVPMEMFFNHNKVLDFKAAGTVELLEVGKSEVITQPYDLIEDYIKKQIFKRL